MSNDRPVVLHKGVYEKTATVSEAVFMITGMTIGAGILGLPYAASQAGILVGAAYILVLGLVMLFFNLILGEIAVRSKENLQLPGLAGKYIGWWAKELMSVIFIFAAVGSLLAYLVGEGQALSALLGGWPDWWSVLFWVLAGIVVWRGLQTVKRMEKILSLAVIAIIVGLSTYLLPQVRIENLWHWQSSQFLLPYGVTLFALYAAPAVAEAHALLPSSQRHFRKALIIGTLIPIAVYLLFTITVAGVGGANTTEIATIGLAANYGRAVSILANVFAVFAMGAAFIGTGTALKQTLVWDHKLSAWWSTLFVLAAPLALFALGLRSFVRILDIVGGLFIGLEAIFVILIYWRAKHRGDLPAPRYNLHHIWLLVIPILLVFTLATISSIVKVVR